MCNIVLIILSVAISPFKHVAFSGDVIVSNMMSQWQIYAAAWFYNYKRYQERCFLFFIKEVTWVEWLDKVVSRKRKLGRMDDKIEELEIEFELLEKEERELLEQQQSWQDEPFRRR